MSWPSCLLLFLWFSIRSYQGQSLLQVTLFDVVVVRLLSEGLEGGITNYCFLAFFRHWPNFFLTTDFFNVEYND